MLVTETPLQGVFRIDIDPKRDGRGFFARTWDAAIANRHGLAERFDYHCVSVNDALHTLRGMHWQREPHGETKLVRCTRGTIVDVIVDMRPDSPTFKRWTALELSAENRRAFYVPHGCAHGFLTMTPDTEVLYGIAGAYVPDAATGIRWNDPAIGIEWPATPAAISERDASYPDFTA